MRLVPPLLNPTKGGFESSNECASYRDRHAGLQSTEARRPTSADTIAKQRPGCPNATEAPRSAAVLSQGWCQAMTKAMRGARHPIRRSHTELRECCQAAAGRNMGCCRGEKRAGTAISAGCTGSGRYVRSMGRGSEKGGICCFVERRKEKKGQG